jgi:PPK2 family polyphosphate:nucleotide phosphotransferase
MTPYCVKPGSHVRLDQYDPDDTSLLPDKVKAKSKSDRLQTRLGELQELLFAEHRHKVLIVLQGMDTSGKDGTIRHVMDGFNPQGVHVSSFRKPSDEELDHDYLWRAHARVPASGGIVVFNRSHYEDVLIVRVHGLVPEEIWRQRYQQIADFERMLCENGTLILKFFLHISKDEQRKRLQERIDDPRKHWKFQHGDLAERELWDDYMDAYKDMLEKTSTKYAPWYVVPANAKWYRNLVVADVITDTLKSLKMEYPKVDLSGEVVE